jgi:DNA-binding NarL/FixJ family response regulator
MPKIILFDDNDSLRQSVKMLLESDPNNEVVGQYADPVDVQEIVAAARPDVVIMDIDMPRMNGIEAVRLAKQARPETEIIMFTVFEDDERLFDSICAGASGYLLKMNSLARLTAAVKDVCEGGSPMSPGIARRVVQHFQQPKANQYALTPREREILQWLVKGYSYKMIASTCKLSNETVKSHMKNIYQKLQVSCGTEAVSKALRERLI